MPAARQASRSSAKALAVSAMIGVRAAACRPLPRGCAAPLRGRRCPACARPSAPDRRARRRRARRAKRRAPPRRSARWSERWPSLRQQRAGQQRVDLVVLRHQDRKVLQWLAGLGCSGMSAASTGRAGMLEHVVGRQWSAMSRALSEADAHRLHQIAGEARLLERGQAAFARPA